MAYTDALQSIGIAYSALGRPDDAYAAYVSAYSILERIGHHFTAGWSALGILDDVVVPYRTADLAERKRLMTTAAEHFRHAHEVMEDESSRYFVNLPVLWLEGRWEEIREAASAGLNFGMSDQRFRSAMILARLARETGNPDRAWEYVYGLMPRGPATEPGGTDFPPSLEIQRLAADLSMDANDLESARAWIEAHDHWLRWSGAVLWRADGHLLWARFHRLSGDLENARDDADHALRLASEPCQPVALLASHRFLGELDVLQRRYDEAACHFEKSIDLAEACAAPFEQALTMLAMAELRTATGDSEAARTLLASVRDIGESLGAGPIVARAKASEDRLNKRNDSLSYPAGLTPREVEVLRLVAQGMSDRRIADELFISRKTVTHHVSHILDKLDLDSRAAAAAFAVRHDLDEIQ
jgi:DNA-binding CsgD family transcriptional regulator